VAAAESGSKRLSGRDISYGGILTALIILFMILSAWSPTADLALFSLTSLCMAIAVIEMGLAKSLVVWLAASLLGLAYPGLQLTWPFFVFFGTYPLLRALIDTRRPRFQAWVIRHLAGLLMLAAGLVLFLLPAVAGWTDRIGDWLWLLIPPAGIILMIVYDYALTLLIQLYHRRIRSQRRT
jgi:hypothetical protein